MQDYEGSPTIQETQSFLGISGKETWNKHYLEKMLTNVKYAGDVALNIGDKIFIYSAHHPAIISHDSFNAVQEQKKLRSNTTENPDGTTTRKPSKYSGKKVLNETFDKKQLLADLGINDD